MATILIFDHSHSERERIASLLRVRGHRILYASETGNIRASVREALPDLIIADVLLPTLDGHELVRRFRAEPAFSSIQVIFCAPEFHEREARALARLAGAFDVLAKPLLEPAVVEVVDAALKSPTPAPSPSDREAFDREEWRRLNVTLAAEIQRLEAERDQIAAVLEAVERIHRARRPSDVFDVVSTETRRLAFAQFSVFALLTEGASTPSAPVTCGLDAAAAFGVKPVLRWVRTCNPGDIPEVAVAVPNHLRVSSLLSVPVASRSQIYGWVSVWNKLAIDEFTDADEQCLIHLGRHAGLAYEKLTR